MPTSHMYAPQPGVLGVGLRDPSTELYGVPAVGPGVSGSDLTGSLPGL